MNNPQEHKHNFNNNLGNDYWKLNNNEEIKVTVNGDAFIRKLTCLDCGIVIEQMWSNKHSEFIYNDKFIQPYEIPCIKK